VNVSRTFSSFHACFLKIIQQKLINSTNNVPSLERKPKLIYFSSNYSITRKSMCLIIHLWCLKLCDMKRKRKMKRKRSVKRFIDFLIYYEIIVYFLNFWNYVKTKLLTIDTDRSDSQSCGLSGLYGGMNQIVSGGKLASGKDDERSVSQYFTLCLYERM
jgi:hypothetical protein